MPIDNRPSGAALALTNAVFDANATVDSATSAATAYPYKNVRIPYRSKRWRSTSVVQQQIAGQFASAIQPRLFALVNSNVSVPSSALAVAQAKATVWLKADTLNLADAAAVTSWPSVGSNTTAFAQGTGANQPIQKTGILDTKAIVRFDGTDDYLDRGASLALGNAHTIILLLKFSAVGATESRMMGSSAAAFSYATGGANTVRYTETVNTIDFSWTPTVSTWYVVRLVRTSTTLALYVNGTQVGTTQAVSASGVFGFQWLGRGVNSTNPMEGDIAEVFVTTDSTFSSADTSAIEDYLIAKWTAPGTLKSVMLELDDSSTFTSSPQRWICHSWTQSNAKVLAYYLGTPDNYDATEAVVWQYLPVYNPRQFWRVTLPASQVQDTDGDGTVDTYHELAAVWLGDIEDLVVAEVGMDMESANSTVEARSGARYVDELGNWVTIDFSLVLNTLAVAQRYVDLIRTQGAKHCILDLHANTTDATLRTYSAFYGFVSERRGLSASLKGGQENDVDVSFEEARG